MAGYIGSKASVVTPGAERKKVFSITTTTTSLTGLVYTPGFVHVYHNGVRLVDGTDYTATNGTSITLTTAAQSGDEVVVVSYATFQTSDTVSASAGGTFSNAVTIDANGATVLTVDRATNNGTIIDLQKDGSSVGTVGGLLGSYGYMYLGSGPTGLRFENAFNIIYPADPSATGVARDAAVDLGYSAGRFKDLYLSGGVYLGGTGAANYLDDYEEGTWTPDLGNSVPSLDEYGIYHKVGRVVFIEGSVTVGANSDTNHFQITNFPFTSGSTQGNRGGSFIRYSNYGDVFWLHINGGANSMGGYVKTGGVLRYSDMSSKRVDFVGFYST